MAEGGAGDSMWAAHSAGFTVNISKFPSTQVADDDTKAHTHTRITPHTPQVRGLSWKASSFSSAVSEMRKRLIQIFGFLLTSLGWVFVLCTLAMDYWRISQIGGQGGSFIIKVAWYWSNLWKDCFTDSTAVTNCRDFPVLWTVTRKNWALIGTVHDYVCVCVHTNGPFGRIISSCVRCHTSCGAVGIDSSPFDSLSLLLSPSFRPGRSRIAHVWDNSRLLRCGALLCGNGVHLHWRTGQN